MEKRYIVIDMPANGCSGDIYQEVYNTPEEANAAADYKWHMLTAQERRHRRIMAGVVTQDMLPDDAIDEDTGAIDWELFGDCDSFPGSFDSQPSFPLPHAIAAVEKLCSANFADMTADVFDHDAWWEPMEAAWIVPVNLENDDYNPRCGEYRFRVSKDGASYDLYRS